LALKTEGGSFPKTLSKDWKALSGSRRLPVLVKIKE